MPEAETSSSASRRAASDPWINRLLVAVLLVLVLVLTAVVYVVYTGVLTGQAPRTLAEKELATLDRAFKASPSDPEVVADYMRALIGVERYAKARSVLGTYRSAEASAAAVVLTEEARLLFRDGDPEEALVVAGEALETARTEKDATIRARASKGIVAPFYSEQIVGALLLQAEVLESLGQLEETLDSLDAALDELGSMADVLAWRGDIAAELGRSEAARADYERALEFIPGFDRALDGLSRLEGRGDE